MYIESLIYTFLLQMLSNPVCFDSNTHRTRTHVNTKVYKKWNGFYSLSYIVN